MTNMNKLKIGAIENDKPVTKTIKLSAAVYRDLIAYAEALSHQDGQAIDPNSLIAPMLARFMATDRAFKRARKQTQYD